MHHGLGYYPHSTPSGSVNQESLGGSKVFRAWFLHSCALIYSAVVSGRHRSSEVGFHSSKCKNRSMINSTAYIIHRIKKIKASNLWELHLFLELGMRKKKFSNSYSCGDLCIILKRYSQHRIMETRSVIGLYSWHDC